MGVQYLGEGLGVSWTDVVGVKGVRDAKESRASELVCLVIPAGAGVVVVVASMGFGVLQGMASQER